MCYILPLLPSSESSGGSGSPDGSSGGGGIDTGLIIGAVAGGLAFAIIVVVVLILVLCYIRRRHGGHYGIPSTDSKDLPLYTSAEPFYSELNKPPPPPLPKRFYDSSPYATIDTPRDNGHIELVPMPNDHRDSTCSAPAVPDGTPMPMKLKHKPEFLQQNPMYLSADHLDRSGGSLSQHRAASVPSLEQPDSPTCLNIYAEPSRVPPPIPPQNLSPPSDAPIYSEALTPSIFLQQRQLDSPPGIDLHPYASIYDDPRPLLKSEGPTEVTHQNIREIRNLGFGQFGQVTLAETVGLSLKDLKLSDTNDDKSVTVIVAMKKLKPNAERAVKEAFEKEIKFMSRLKDENVVRLLGICAVGSPFIVMEYMENGDLNQYLRKHDIAPPEEPAGEHQIPAAILLYMAVQISGGMRYLASLKFIHRDLATRNCLVGRNNTVKIADFGMSRNLYSSYYYRIKGRAMLPIRWMANECFYGKFSEKTDVWAFGVTMWEIFTFAKIQPYEGMSDQEVIDDAVKGQNRMLLPIPEYCPQEVYEVMLRCWVHEPEERADFDEIHTSLAAIHAYSDI